MSARSITVGPFAVTEQAYNAGLSHSRRHLVTGLAKPVCGKPAVRSPAWTTRGGRARPYRGLQDQGSADRDFSGRGPKQVQSSCSYQSSSTLRCRWITPVTSLDGALPSEQVTWSAPGDVDRRRRADQAFPAGHERPFDRACSPSHGRVTFLTFFRWTSDGATTASRRPGSVSSTGPSARGRRVTSTSSPRSASTAAATSSRADDAG